MNILFTCAGRRNYLIEYFKEALSSRGKVYAADMQLSAPAMVAAHKAFVVPPIYNPNYVNEILNICQNEHITAVFSLNDLELPILAANESKFTAVGTKLIVSSQNVIHTCSDKWETVRFADSLGIDSPRTFLSLETAKAAIREGSIKFPLVIKPRWGSASIGIEFPESIEELEITFKLLELRLKRTILAKASAEDFEKAILIQEKINGTEYGVDILNDFEGRNISVYVKEKLAMRAGETDKAILRNIPELENIGNILANSIKHIGNMDCDFFFANGKYYLLEMNPRFGGGYPFTQVSGGNYPAIIIDLLNGVQHKTKYLQKNFDVAYSKCDTLIPVGGII